MICTWRREPFLTPYQRKWRLVMLACGAAILVLLSVWNPITQPGPMMCGLRRIAALPCVTCGMTRGASLCLRGQPIEATTYNPLTIPVFLFVAFLGIKWLYECLVGSYFRLVWDRRWARALYLLLVLVILANWAYMIAYRREDSFDSSLLGQVFR